MYRAYTITSDAGKSHLSIIRLSDNAAIPADPDNTDFVEYQKWLSEGNTPHSADGTTNLTSLNREAE
jgi:hypothetical protein